MSVYTNDVDTLRQVIGSTLPNLFQSLITLISTFVSMIVLSMPLTLVSILMAFITVKVTTALGKISKGFFVERQKNLGKVNGFIEEMVSGQRVVKVYCHEKKAVEDFTALNEQLRSSAYNANKVGSMVMPINGNIGNLGYVLTAVVGALIALGGFTAWYLCGIGGASLTLGTLVAFLSLQKNFTRPISSIYHALVERIETRHGLRQLSYMKELGMGNDNYILIDLDNGGKHITPQDAAKDLKPFLAPE